MANLKQKCVNTEALPEEVAIRHFEEGSKILTRLLVRAIIQEVQVLSLRLCRCNPNIL